MNNVRLGVYCLLLDDFVGYVLVQCLSLVLIVRNVFRDSRDLLL